MEEEAGRTQRDGIAREVVEYLHYVDTMKTNLSNYQSFEKRNVFCRVAGCLPCGSAATCLVQICVQLHWLPGAELWYLWGWRYRQGPICVLQTDSGISSFQNRICALALLKEDRNCVGSAGCDDVCGVTPR